MFCTLFNGYFSVHLLAFFQDLLRSLILNSYTLPSFRTISSPTHTFMKICPFIYLLTRPFVTVIPHIGHILAFFQDPLSSLILNSYTLPSFRTISSPTHTFMKICPFIYLLTRPFVTVIPHIGHILAFFQDPLSSLILNSYTLPSFRTISSPTHTFMKICPFIYLLTRPFVTVIPHIGHILAFFQDPLSSLILNSYTLPSFRTISSPTHTFMKICPFIYLLTRPFVTVIPHIGHIFLSRPHISTYTEFIYTAFFQDHF